MKFTRIPTDTFKNLQMNAGILLDSFDPTTGEIGKLIGATTGGFNFTATPTFSDFGEDIDNAPKNVKELKVLDSWEAKMTGTFVTVTPELAHKLIGAADVKDEIHIVPRNDLADSDFSDLWWVGDYSNLNGDQNGGFCAVHLINSLSTDGFQIQSTDKGKGQFAFGFTGHYSMAEQDKVPFEVFVKVGEEESPTPTYTYTPVTPEGTENPSEEGWYEESGSDYVLTEDTTVEIGKTYYTRQEV